MNRIRSRCLIVLALALLPCNLLAVGEGGSAIVIVADSRRFSGWKAVWANLYNESHVGLTIATIVIIPAISILLGKLTGSLLGRIGINLRSRELAER